MMRLTFHSLLMLGILSVNAAAFELTPQQQANLRVTTAKVSESQAAATLTVSGTVRADQQRLYRVAPIVEGIVMRLHATEYSTVRKGQLLAHLHSNTLGQAQTDYLEALAKFEQVEADYQRIKGLTKDGVVASSRMVEAESLFKAAQAMLQQRRNTLTLAGVTPTQIDDLAKHPDAIADYQLYSPTNGLLLEVAVENGQMLAAGESAFRIADLSEVIADIRIPATLLGKVGKDAKVTVKTAAFANEGFAGRLSALSGEVDPNTQTVAGRVIVPNADGKLRPGMYLQAELAGVEQSGLMAPESAVFRSGNDSYIFTVQGERKYEPVKVSVTPAGQGMVRIESGLAAGVMIVTGGVAELKSHWQYKGGE